ncbi:MAG: ATP-binding cassette domain-containing protein [Candidatus Goldbacteria bacterium]|nr:ATP-binding cassette domain-containing protein [Candidatus Goldiibacteriota bacterium]
MIKFKHVYKIYEKDIRALDDISFEICDGELVFITGPSGAGKSTILNLLYREDVPTMGTILVNDTDISHLRGGKISKYRRSIGFVFQDFKLLFDRCVFDNIALPLEVVGTNRQYIKRVVLEYIKKIGLSGKEKLNPWHLSGGEKQKVAIARALITSPSLILADEPTGNLDDFSAWEVITMLLDANKAGTTVIIATHNKEIISRVGGRVIKLDKGRLIHQ